MSTEDAPLTPRPLDRGPFPVDVYEPAGCVLARAYRPHYQQVLQLPVRDDDVWVVSHPKCGTTWASQMIWLLRNNLDYSGAEKQIEERVPFLEVSSIIFNRMDERQAAEYKKTQPLLFGDSFRFVAEMPDPRTIKSHLQWDLLPRDLRRPDSKAKIIYVARDAKDACISYYYHYRLLYNYPESLEEFAEHFLSGSITFSPFWKHLLGYWSRRDQQNVMFLKYDDMKKDLPAVIHEINAFLNLPALNAEQVEKLTQHLSFQNMKNNTAVNMSGTISAVKKSVKEDVDAESEQFIRKGVVGDYKEKMTSDMIRRFNEWAEKETQGSGLTF